ncbi:FUSC family protein [Actinomadura parmotrematis]|uniref:FUSC family protein n=1 Tax=Actinomadura parmotrematis TaxID=2864039 RepID=A0ABS7G4M9_9ACTN|nr:FUSC family protein [Actinomadura parmotrematis]MBW8486747.1 FUSC family protein [Actinomadura parmotrematis]
MHHISGRLPSLGLLGRSAGIVLVAAVPVGAAWWLVEGTAAQAVYLGMTFMTVAARRLPVAEQCWVGFSAGVAAAAGALVAGNTPLLLLVVAAACALQWAFNRRSVGTAALLPSNLVLYSVIAPGNVLQVAAATWLGAAVTIVAAALVRMRVPPEPAPDRDAALHALELAAGCIALVLLTGALDLPRGNWAVLTLCLVFVPAAGETTARTLGRALGTAAGAVVAVAVAAAVPPAVCLVLAGLCAILTVAYALLPDDLLYAAFLTPTVLLLFSSGRAGATLQIAVQRVEMTIVGAALAIALALAATAWQGRR